MAKRRGYEENNEEDVQMIYCRATKDSFNFLALGDSFVGLVWPWVCDVWTYLDLIEHCIFRLRREERDGVVYATVHNMNLVK